VVSILDGIIKMKCQRQYLDCTGEAEGEVSGNRNVCKACLERGERFDIEFKKNEV